MKKVFGNSWKIRAANVKNNKRLKPETKKFVANFREKCVFFNILKIKKIKKYLNCLFRLDIPWNVSNYLITQTFSKQN